jgi:hypothetical protein
MPVSDEAGLGYFGEAMLYSCIDFQRRHSGARVSANPESRMRSAECMYARLLDSGFAARRGAPE